MVGFNDTKTSSDPPDTHVPFADYVITVASCTVDCILCSFEDTNIHTLVIQKATCCQLHNNLHLFYLNTVVDLIDLSISTCHVLLWCDLDALAKNINGQYVLLTVYKLRGGGGNSRQMNADVFNHRAFSHRTVIMSDQMTSLSLSQVIKNIQCELYQIQSHQNLMCGLNLDQ